MKLNKLFLLGAIALGLVACNKNGVSNEQSREIKSVSIKISNSNMESRAIEAPVTAATNNIVKSALLMFTNGTTDASKVVFTKVLDQATDLTAILSTTNLNKGYTIKVPAAATSVFVVLNTTTVINSLAMVNNSVAQVKAAVLKINDMNNKAAGADANTTGSITMFGNGATLTADALAAGFGPNATASDLYATLTVAPVVSRVELTKVEPKTGSQIVSFTLDGVFVKKFDQDLTLGGTASNNVDYSNVTPVTPQILNANFYTQADGSYNGDNKYMRNMSALTTGNVAGYQVAPSAAPVLVLKLSNIKLTGNVDYGDDATKKYYVVIRGYKNAAGGAAIPTFTANNVYKLDLSGANGIDVNNITEDVDAILKAVWVGVTITPWTVVNVTPVF